ncbi:MAG: TIGR03016 family PEP-CTERM system-associated outer membrane protein [Xanthomonadaceae bacterium]|nr:TIGR03016 family PEP-CTERM system-associated outer membrane protein [Xanthomonadaceae bacterium]
MFAVRPMIDRRNNTYHQFAGDGRVELMPERFFVESAATYSQRLISAQGGGGGGDNLNVFGNRSDVATFRLSPFYIQPVGDFATGQLRYTYDRVDYVDSSVSGAGSESNRMLARLDSGAMFSRIGWGLSFNRTETEYDDGSSVTFQMAEALVRLNITNRLSVFAAGGEEDNDFVQDPSRARPDDTFWRAGATWQPGNRTTMEGFYGERYFGETYGGNLQHRFRNSRFFMDYTEAPTTVNEFELQRVVLPIVDEAGIPVIIDGEPVFIDVEFPDLRAGVYLSRRFTAGFSGDRPKTSWGIRYFDEQREYEVSNREERVTGVAANASWRVAPRTRLVLNASVQEISYSLDDRQDTYYITGAGLVRDMTPRTTASLNYRFVERESNLAGNEYHENRITASFRANF